MVSKKANAAIDRHSSLLRSSSITIVPRSPNRERVPRPVLPTIDSITVVYTHARMSSLRLFLLCFQRDNFKAGKWQKSALFLASSPILVIRRIPTSVVHREAASLAIFALFGQIARLCNLSIVICLFPPFSYSLPRSRSGPNRAVWGPCHDVGIKEPRDDSALSACPALS